MGCDNVKKGKTCYTATNPDGDATSAINVFYDSLLVLNHTRPDFPEKADIIDLVEYIKKMYITHAISWICEVCGYSFYDTYKKTDEVEIDPCLAVLKDLEPKTSQIEEPLICLNDKVLYEYVQYPNVWFRDEGISYYVQELFEVGYSVKDECITIPIRDELGNLVGVKARRTKDSIEFPKYWFPYPVPKTKILYGLDKAIEYIREEGKVIVFEAEKSVQKSFSMGFCNAVSLGGHEISDTQAQKLEKLGVDIVLALDKDISPKEIKKQAKKFLIRDRLYAIIPNKNKNLLKDKDAPVDRGIDTFIKLYNEDLYKVPM